MYVLLESFIKFLVDAYYEPPYTYVAILWLMIGLNYYKHCINQEGLNAIVVILHLKQSTVYLWIQIYVRTCSFCDSRNSLSANTGNYTTTGS